MISGSRMLFSAVVVILGMALMAPLALADSALTSGPAEQDSVSRLAVLESKARLEAANKALVKRWLQELWDEGDFSVAGELLSADFTRHSAEHPANDPDAYIAIIRSCHDGFPDTEIIQVDELLAEGDRVFVRWRWTGTDQAEFLGVPATGKAIDVYGEDVIRIQDGRITDVWPLFDPLRVMLQIGAIKSAE
jgi:steroid delta-isomerase-like uncharacterized protein